MTANTILGNGVVTFPGDTTANRPSPVSGMMRFNTTLNLMEYYDGTQWKAIDSPPTITAVSPTTYNGETGTSFTVTGSNFQTGAIIYFIDSSNTVYTATTTTVTNSSSITATTPQDFTVAQGPLSVKILNPSGLFSTYASAILTGGSPVWSTASGSLGTIYDSARSGKSFQVTATDPDAGATISYSLYSGSLPSGMSISSGGLISGTAGAVVSDTTYTFTIRATDNAGNTADRSFSILIKAPAVQSFTSGSSNWTVPTGLTSVQVLVVGAGGAGGGATGFEGGGGGGAGGLVIAPAYPVTPGGSIPYSIGSGGYGITCSPNNSVASIPSGIGGNSVFGNITANGGGYGGGQYWSAYPGGSGGGQAGNGCAGPVAQGPGGAAYGGSTQGPSGGGTGYGNRGGYTAGGHGADATGAGGGGAGGAGADNAPGTSASPGGVGLAYSITGSSVYYAGGGGGGNAQDGHGAGTGGSGGGGNGGGTNPGGTNTGGGGGGYTGGSGAATGNGGPGVVIIRY